MAIKKIRVVHIISSLERGGAQAVLYELLYGTDPTRFEHHVIYFYPGPYVEKIQKLHIKTYHIAGIVAVYDPLFMYQLYSCIKTIQPHCLHTSLWSANLLGKIFGKLFSLSTIQVLHNTTEYNGFIRNIIDKIITFKPVRSIAVSDSVKQSWKSLKNVKVIKNGINPCILKEQDNGTVKTRKELGLSKKHFIIGTVGRFDSVKNYGLLLTTLALLYDDYPLARLLLVGGGKQESFLRQRAYDLGISDRVIFIINKPAQNYYALFDCFAQTSFSEGLSIALLEAMLFSLPVIVTSQNKKHDVIVDKENGLVIPSGDADAFAKGLAFYMNNKKERKKMAQQGYKNVSDHFDVQTMISSYSHLYEELISK